MRVEVYEKQTTICLNRPKLESQPCARVCAPSWSYVRWVDSTGGPESACRNSPEIDFGVIKTKSTPRVRFPVPESTRHVVSFCGMAGVLGACASRLASRTRCAVDCVDLAADLECPRPLKCAKLDAAVGLSSLGLGPESGHAESTHAFESMQLDADAGPPLSVGTGGIEAMLSDGDLRLLAQVYWQLGRMQLPAGALPDASITPSDVAALVLLVITNAGPCWPVLFNRDGTPLTRFQLVSWLLTANVELFKMHAHVLAQDATDALLENINTAIEKITAVAGRLVTTLSTPELPCTGGESEAGAGGSDDAADDQASKVASAGTDAPSEQEAIAGMLSLATLRSGSDDAADDQASKVASTSTDAASEEEAIARVLLSLATLRSGSGDTADDKARKVASTGTDAASEEEAIARVLLSLATLRSGSDAGTAAATSEQWVCTKNKVMAESARELRTESRRGGGAPIKASNKVIQVPWRKEEDLARWTLAPTIELRMQILKGFIEQLPLGSKSSEGQVHPHLNVSRVQIPVEQLPGLEKKLREVYPRTSSASASSKSTEKKKWLTKFFCSIGMMDDKSHPLPNVKRLKFLREVWNQNGYRLIKGGCNGGGKPRIQHLDS